MSGRSALVAVLVAFGVGLVGALSLKPAPPPSGGGPAGASSRSVVHWRVPSAFGTNLPALGENVVEVSERIARSSGNHLLLEVFDPGTVVPAFDIVDAVAESKVEAGYTWLGYDQGRIPVSVLFGSVPFGFEPWGYMAWWYGAGGRELAEEIYAPLGVRPILCGIIGPETAGWFRDELQSVDDLVGLKIRFAGLGGKVLQRLGASVTMLPGGEIFQALEKGAIDASEYSLPAVDARLGFDRVAKLNYFPGWHQPSTAAHLVVNRRDWAALTLEGRGEIESGCAAGVASNLALAEFQQGPALTQLDAKGVRIERLPNELIAALAETSRDVLAEEAAADADFARVLAHQTAFRRGYDRWRSLAYLPVDATVASKPAATRAGGSGAGAKP